MAVVLVEGRGNAGRSGRAAILDGDHHGQNLLGSQGFKDQIGDFPPVNQVASQHKTVTRVCIRQTNEHTKGFGSGQDQPVNQPGREEGAAGIIQVPIMA